MAIKGRKRLFRVIQNIDSMFNDIFKQERIPGIAESDKVIISYNDDGEDTIEIKKGVIIRDYELNSFIECMEEPENVFDYIEEVSIAEEILNKLFEKNTISYYDCRDYKVDEEVALLDIRKIEIYDPENDESKGSYHVLTYENDSFESADTQIELTEEETEYLIKIKKGANNVN